MKWNREHALKTGRATTRDGRQAFSLREYTIDGQPIIMGQLMITAGKPPHNGTLKTEGHFWDGSGLGSGADDLMGADHE